MAEMVATTGLRKAMNPDPIKLDESGEVVVLINH